MIDLRKMAIGYLCAMAFIIGGDYTAQRWLLPVSHWVEYEKVTQIGPIPLGGPIRFESAINRYRVSDMIYNDTLFCNFGGDKYEIFSAQGGEFADAQPRTADNTAGWWYSARVPDKPVSCYLRSVTQIRLGYGIIRSLPTVYTESFMIGKEQ